MAHNTQLSACSSRICKPSAVVPLFSCLVVVFFPRIFFWRQLRVKLRPQLASVGPFLLTWFCVSFTLCIGAFLNWFLTCCCFHFPIEQIKQDQHISFEKLNRIAHQTLSHSCIIYDLIHLWPEVVMNLFMLLWIRLSPPDNSFCVREAAAIFDRMFGTLAGGSQRTDGVLILSAAFLPPILHHSTYHSLLTRSHVVVLLFPQGEKNSPLLSETLNAAHVGRNWLWKHVCVSCHAGLCTTLLSVTLNVFISLLYNINKHQRLNVS